MNKSKQDGWREKKRRETLQRITETALRLFVSNGYEATTLEVIAEAASISRRTFFYYFSSKEDILAAWQKSMPDALRTAILAEPTRHSPLDVVRNANLELLAHYDAERGLMIERIVRSNETLRTGCRAQFVRLEEVIFEALCEIWPQKAQHKTLRIVAMASAGVLRLAVDTWAEDEGRKPLTKYLEDVFADLKTALSG